MTNPIHILNVGFKPVFALQYALQDKAIERFTAKNYRHKISWHGGDDTASCDVDVTLRQAEYIFKNYIGNGAFITVDNPESPIFEGFISAVTLQIGGITFRRSLDEMANRVYVTYYNADSPAAQKTETTAVTNNASSQAIYGIKTSTLDADVHFNNANKTHKTVLRDTIRSVLAYPQISVQSGGGGGVSVSIEIKGWYHFVWGWEYWQHSSGAIDIASNRFINTGIGGNRGTNIDYVCDAFPTAGYAALIQTNNTFQISADSKTGQTYLQYLQSIVEAGDGTQEWVFGITRVLGLKSAGLVTRRAYYRAANTAVKYTARALGTPGVVYDLFGREIPGWTVKPDCAIRITDVLANFEGVPGDNPQLSYIKFIEYDGENQAVTWQSSDDGTLEGALGVRKYFKQHGKRFGAPKRQLV